MRNVLDAPVKNCRIRGLERDVRAAAHGDAMPTSALVRR